MKIFKGQLSDIWTPTITPDGFDHVSPAGGYVTTYAGQGVVREGGVTKVRTKPFDLSKYYTYDNRYFSLWTHVGGSNGNQGAVQNKGVTVAYQACYTPSGATWLTIATLRASGTSINGTSGTAYANVSTPLIGPWWRLEFSYARAHSTADMTVDYALCVE